MQKQPGKFLKALPNIITCIRLIAAVVLVHLSVTKHTVAFYVIYGVCGLTDLLDGTIARATNTCSKLGSRLDSVADLTFLGVMAYKIIPICLEKLTFANWILIGVPSLLHICSYLVCIFKFKKLSSLHTYANKAMSALIFLFPFTLIGDYAPLYQNYVYAGSVIAIYSGLECLLIHCIAKRYDPKNQTIWVVKKNERAYLASQAEIKETKEENDKDQRPE